MAVARWATFRQGSIFDMERKMRFFNRFLWIAALSGWVVMAGCQSASLTSAKLYMQEDDLGRAKAQLEDGLVTTPDNPEIHFLLGKIAGVEGDFAAMAASLGRSEELSSKFGAEIEQMRRHYWAGAWNRGVGLATAEEPDYAGAREAFEEATVIDPKGIQAWRNLAFAHYRLEDMDAAIATYRQIIALAPDDSSAHANLGAVCIQEKRYPEAAEALAKLIEISPGDASTHVNLGIAYEQLEQLNEAESAYKKAIELDPDLALAHYGLGNFYWNREQFEGARDAYEKAVAVDSSDENVRFNLAMSYLRLEDDDGALPLLEQLSEEMPSNGVVWQQLSLIYARKGRIPEAKSAEAMAKSLGH
jgi:tetratricopeptide (TPR) repeat protein